MNAAPGIDLLLIEDEEDLFRDGDLIGNAGAIAARWAFDPPKLAVPLLSAYAKAAGHRVEAISRPLLPWQRGKFRALLARRPLVAGLTTVAMFDPAYAARITSQIRRLSPGTVIVLGGHGAADIPEVRALGDVFISNHGEWQLAALVSELKKGTPLSAVPGAIPAPGGKFRIEGSLRYEGMPHILAPDWTVASTLARRWPVEASRGCKYNCSYCIFPAHSGQTFRPAEEVVREIAGVSKNFGRKYFDFVDSSLTADADFVRALCAGLKAAGLRIDWKCFARPDAFDRDPGLAAEMAAAGCSRVFMGIEAIHDDILGRMRRGMDRAAVERGLQRAFDAGIKVHGNFIIGFPGETEATVLDTVKFVSGRPFSSVYLCTFAVSQDMLDLAAREPERYMHLAGKPAKRWRHDGMDYAEAYRLTRLAARKINLSKMSMLAISPISNDPAVPPL